MMNKLKNYGFAASFLVLGLLACKKEEPVNNPGNNSQTEANTFEVRMTDEPGDYEALDVEIVKMEAYLENEGWVTLINEAQTVSVLELKNGAETQLALKSDAKAGTYSRLKLTFGTNNTIAVQARATATTGVDSASASGTITFNMNYEGPKEYEIEINEEVSAEAGASVLLDFHVAKSVKEEFEEYVLKPVITQIKDSKTGVEGRVSGAAKAMVLLTNGQDSLSTYIDANGEFLLKGMNEGTYDLICMPSADDEWENDLPNEERIEGVVVTQGEIYNAGEIRL